MVDQNFQGAVVIDDTGRLEIGELDEGRKGAGRTMWGGHWAATPFGGGGAAPSVAWMIALTVLGALCESGGGAVSCCSGGMISATGPPLRPRRRDSRMQRPPALGAGALGAGRTTGLVASVSSVELNHFWRKIPSFQGETRPKPITGYDVNVFDPAAICRGPIPDNVDLGLADEFKTVSSFARKPVKITMTGPHLLAVVAHDEYYNDTSANDRRFRQTAPPKPETPCGGGL